MTKFTTLTNYLFLLMGIAILGLTSCGEDNVIDTEIPPSVSIFADVLTINPGETITLTITGSKGDGDMNALTITEDGSNVDLARINSNDIGANPALLLGDAVSSFSFTVEIEGPTTPGDYSYEASVSDANNRSGSDFVTVSVISSPPTIMVNGSSALEIDPNVTDVISFNIDATASGGELSTISVAKDGELIPVADMRFEGATVDANPYTLTGDYVNGFTMASVGAVVTTSGTYVVEITDVNGQMANTSVEVTVQAATPLNVEYTERFVYNSDAPTGFFGAFDLDTGESVASSDNAAELQDMGLDANDEWQRRIMAEGNAVLKAPGATSPELFDYDAVTTFEALSTAFDSGEDVSSGTDRIEVGNVFVVKNNDDYYIISIVDIQEVSSNQDYYELSVKGYRP